MLERNVIEVQMNLIAHGQMVVMLNKLLFGKPVSVKTPKLRPCEGEQPQIGLDISSAAIAEKDRMSNNQQVDERSVRHRLLTCT
jgi:hypothetical protein